MPALPSPPATARRRLLGGAAVALCVSGALALLAGCGGGGAGGQGLDVVATTTQLGDFVRVVGGARVSLHQILRPNTDPHEYEPRPADVTSTAGATLVFESGDRLDAWMGKVISEAGGSPSVVDVGAAVPERRPGESSGPEASRFDPHWWHDPRNAEAAVRVIRDRLIRADPAGRPTFTANARTYLARLRRLDAGIGRCFARIPADRRTLVTDHDAFGYFARRYGIRIVGAIIPSQTTQAQPSARDVARLVTVIRRERVRAVFPESSVNPKLAQAIAAETGASARYTLYGDTLGPAGSPGATYLGMEAANADAMVRGMSGGRLGCAIGGLA
jgi:zinc/manganese transport system substrate-binding protein